MAAQRRFHTQLMTHQHVPFRRTTTTTTTTTTTISCNTAVYQFTSPSKREKSTKSTELLSEPAQSQAGWATWSRNADRTVFPPSLPRGSRSVPLEEGVTTYGSAEPASTHMTTPGLQAARILQSVMNTPSSHSRLMAHILQPGAVCRAEENRGEKTGGRKHAGLPM